MGNLASKVKGDSPRSSSYPYPWSSAPSGSWVIRFSPGHPTETSNKISEIKGLPLYHWSSPDWVTGDIFDHLMFVVVQIFFEGNPNKLIRLIEEPLEAAEMIAQFNTFIDSTNQDITELRNQLFEAAHENIHLHFEDEQLLRLDLLVTNEFDPQYEVRAVISRKNRNSKSSLLQSVSSTFKTKLGSFKKKKGRQASHNNPVQQYFPVPSRDSTVVNTPLRPTAPLLFDSNERTETVTSNNDVDNADEVCITAVFDTSKIKNGTKDGDKQRVKAESKNAKSTRNFEERNAEIKLEMPTLSLLLPSTAEQSLGNEVIAKHKDVSCSKAIQEKGTDAYSSLTGVRDGAVPLQANVNSDKEKSVDESRCVQENSGENCENDVHGQVSDNVIHTDPCTGSAKVWEQYSSYHGPVCSDVVSGSKQAKPGDHSHDDDPVYDNVPSGSKQAEPSEHRKNDDPVYYNAPSGSKHAEPSEHRKDDDPVYDNVPSGTKHAEPSEHRKDDGPVYDNAPSGSKQAEPSEHRKDDGPVCDNAPYGPKQVEPSEHRKDDGPIYDNVPFDSKQVKPSEHRKDDGPNYDSVPSVSRQAEPSEHRKDDGLVCADSLSGIMHTESNEDEDNNGPVLNDGPPDVIIADSTQHYNNDDPVMAPPGKSSPSTFLPIYGLSKSCFKSTTQRVTCSTEAQERCTNVREEKEECSSKPQIHKPSSSSLVYLPFHGLTRGCCSPPWQGESTGFQSRKRKADIDKDDEVQVASKRLNQDDIFSGAEGNRGPSGPEHLESSKQRRDNSPTFGNVPSGAKEAESKEHQQDGGPVCADSSSGIMHTKSNEDEDNNGPVLNDGLPDVINADSTQHYNNDDPVGVMAPPGKSSPSTFLPIYGLSKSWVRSTTQPVSKKAQERCANVKEEKEEHSGKTKKHKPSSSSFVYLPFHGLSRGCFNPPQQGGSTGAWSRKRKADIDESKGDEFTAKRLKQENASSEACNSNEGADHQRSIADDAESDGGNDSSSSESVEWHDALEDTEP